MRYKFVTMLLFLTHIGFFSSGQICPAKNGVTEGKDSLVKTGINQTADIRLHCSASIFSTDPLYIIDGKLVDVSDIKAIQAEDIKSIDILRDTLATALYGSRGANGAVIITMKKADETKILVRDALSGKGVPMATIKVAGKKEVFWYTADEEGSVRIENFKEETDYRIYASAAGYYNSSVLLRKKKEYIGKEIILTPQVRELKEVVLHSRIFFGNRKIEYNDFFNQAGFGILRCLTAGKRVIKATDTRGDSISCFQLKKVYPDPVSRSQVLKLEVITGKTESVQIKLQCINGLTVFLQEFTKAKGAAVFEIPVGQQWAAGIYIVTVFSKEGNLIRSQQVVVN